MSEIRVDNITDEAGTGRPSFTNGVQTSNINGGQVGGRRNLIINGNFDIWQRGTGFTNVTDYTADRWYALASGADLNVSRESFTEGQTDVPNSPRYYLRFEVVTGNDNVRLTQPIEDVRTFSGQQITISYWARLSSGTQPALDKIRLRQQFDTSDTDTVYTDGDPMPTLTSSWQKIVQTITVPSISGKTIGSNDYLGIALAWQTDNSTNSYTIDFAQVQVELGDTATEFEHRSYGEELALCQRYYQIVDCPDTPGGLGINFNRVRDSQNLYSHTFELKTEMRASPSFSSTNVAVHVPGVTGDDTSATFPDEVQSKPTAVCLSVIPSSDEGGSHQIIVLNDGVIEFDAEL